VIFNRRIASVNTDWTWVKYTGDNPHTNHMYVSVVADDRADDPSGWGLRAGGPPMATSAGPAVETATPPEVLPGETSDVAFQLQLLLIRIGLIPDTPGNRDHHYGELTQKVIKKFQIDHGLFPDMKVGPKTWRALFALEPG
jgi:peptidoglycan hydrolase-like protein with peptidoglycan-binding domain